MYHIRRADNHDERSIHVENPIGLSYAVEEASLRAKHTGIDHQIVDDNGEILFVVTDIHHEQLDGMAGVAAKQWQIPQRIFWISAVFVALMLAGAFR